MAGADFKEMCKQFGGGEKERRARQPGTSDGIERASRPNCKRLLPSVAKYKCNFTQQELDEVYLRFY